MEGKILYGKITSPKFIAEASLADSFSFDLQRFEGWSIDSNNKQYTFGTSDTAFASLTNYSGNTAGAWSIKSNSNSSTVTLDLTSNDTNIASISSSISGASKTSTVFNASGLSAPFYFKLDSNTPIVSIMGGSGADSIIGGSKTTWIGGGSGADSLVAGANYTTLDGGAGDDYLDNNGKSNITFVYDGKGKDTIAFSTLSQAILLTNDISGLPGVESVGTDNDNLLLNFGGSGSNSLVFAGGASGTIAFNRAGTSDILYYSKDKIDENHKSVSLTGAASSFFATSNTYKSACRQKAPIK